MLAAATFDQLQSRNYSVLASATRLCSLIVDRSRLFTAHCNWVLQWVRLEYHLQKLTTELSDPLMDQMSRAQLEKIAPLMQTAHDKLSILIREWGDHGFRSTVLYASIVDKVETLNNRLKGRIDFMIDAHSRNHQAMTLSSRDQAYFVEIVSSPASINSNLAAAVRRHCR